MILKVEKQNEYELLDSGNGSKLERFGQCLLVRPDPEALWKKGLPESIWQNRDLEFIRKGEKTKWEKKEGVPGEWRMMLGNLNSIKVLNLFAYTGGATLACAQAGAEVAHVDGSKTAVTWARENAELSGLKDAPIRWIVEDCTMFLKREMKRGNKYDAIIMDPPSFGHGPKDELWKIEENFLELMELCKQILSEKPLFILINGYTAGYSAIAYQNNLSDMTKGLGGNIEIGELTIKESNSDRLLPCGIFARWSRN